MTIMERTLKASYSHCMMRATGSFTRALKILMVNNACAKCYLGANCKPGRGQRDCVVIDWTCNLVPLSLSTTLTSSWISSQ